MQTPRRIAAPPNDPAPQERRNFLKRLFAFAAGGAFVAAARDAWPATQATNQYLGEIMLVPYPTLVPLGWARCDGQIMPIAQNTALFSLIGTTYGGNGQTTFALPDLRGRAPIHSGQGPGLSNRFAGEAGGSENVTLLTTQLPQHSHLIGASSAVGTSDDPTNRYVARNGAGEPMFTSSAPGQTLAAGAVQNTGGSQPHSNMPPYLTMSYLISLNGIYPSSSEPTGPQSTQ
jgi:microcystin-dependent protein